MAPNEEEEYALSPTQCIVSDGVENVGKSTWIALRIASAFTYLPDSAFSDFYLLPDYKQILAGKRFSPNKDVITAIKGLFCCQG